MVPGTITENHPRTLDDWVPVVHAVGRPEVPGRESRGKWFQAPFDGGGGRGADWRAMGISLGAVLTDALLERLSGRDLERLGMLVIPLATIDPAGWPHIALLSYSEVVACDPGTLRLAIGGRSGSAANLRRTGHATVLLFDTGLVHYIKGTARERQPSMQSSPWNASFDVSVTDVLADATDPYREGESFVRGGVTFVCDPSWAAGRTAVLAELRADIHR
jgi:hypothetical protein